MVFRRFALLCSAGFAAAVIVIGSASSAPASPVKLVDGGYGLFRSGTTMFVVQEHMAGFAVDRIDVVRVSPSTLATELVSSFVPPDAAYSPDWSRGEYLDGVDVIGFDGRYVLLSDLVMVSPGQMSSGISVYDTVMKVFRRIATPTPSNNGVSSASISAGRVAFIQAPAGAVTGGGEEVFLHDVASGATRRLTTDSAFQGWPKIAGNTVVWVDGRRGGGSLDFYACDLETFAERRLSFHDHADRFFDFDGSAIVWHYSPTGSLDPGNYDVYTLNLTTGVEQRLTTAASRQMQPSISGGFVTWRDYGSSTGGAYVLDLASRAATRVAGAEAGRPVVAGGVVAWIAEPVGTPGGGRSVWAIDMGAGITPVVPRVSTPAAPAIMRRNVAATVSGTLSTSESVSSGVVRIYRYRKVNGSWRPYGYVAARSIGARYSAAVRLPYPGTWRLRAYHVAHGDHGASWSAGYDYVTVR